MSIATQLGQNGRIFFLAGGMFLLEVGEVSFGSHFFQLSLILISLACFDVSKTILFAPELAPWLTPHLLPSPPPPLPNFFLQRI